MPNFKTGLYLTARVSPPADIQLSVTMPENNIAELLRGPFVHRMARIRV